MNKQTKALMGSIPIHKFWHLSRGSTFRGQSGGGWKDKGVYMRDEGHYAPGDTLEEVLECSLRRNDGTLSPNPYSSVTLVSADRIEISFRVVFRYTDHSPVKIERCEWVTDTINSSSARDELTATLGTVAAIGRLRGSWEPIDDEYSQDGEYKQVFTLKCKPVKLRKRGNVPVFAFGAFLLFASSLDRVEPLVGRWATVALFLSASLLLWCLQKLDERIRQLQSRE